ncbi:MAG: 6-pyruvoyl-tetrahydropterin synthase-related protein, partial [Patescibacteria group bacterium]
LFSSGLPLTHDGQDHVVRIANFYKNLQEGNIVPRWAGNLNWGYGHPVLMFLYPLPSYMASLFHFLGASFVDSVKLVFGISFILSGFSMYVWIKSFWSREAAFFASTLYLFAPYRFIDLYVRGAIGEHVAFIFPPLIFYFLLKLSRNPKWTHIIGGSLSLAGFILSHNAITLMFLPIIFLYIFYLIYQSKLKTSFMLNTLYLILIGFGLASFFWVPAFFEGKYTLRDIVTKGAYLTRFVNPKDFLYGLWSYGGTGQFTVQVGIVQWVMVLVSILLLWTKKRKETMLIGGALVLFGLTLFIMTEYSSFLWLMITTLQKFQFPWRFLSVIVFLTALMGGFVVEFLGKNKKMIVIGLVLITLFVNKDYWHANGFLQKPETFYTGVYDGTTDTGESAPIWSIRFMEKRPDRRAEVISGMAYITELQRSSTSHTYSIVSETKSQIRENTIYFPGWHVFVGNNEVPLEFQDQHNRGVMTFLLSQGEHTVRVVFRDTRLRTIGNYISLGCLVILCAYSILRIRLWRRFRLY